MVQALDKKFVWDKAITSDQSPDLLISEIDEALNRWTALVFGECGQGKSTTLNKIVEIAKEKYFPGKEFSCNFESKQSFKSVTSCVQLGTLGNITLIDTPGLNDPDQRRSDKNIHIEIIKNLSISLYDS